MRLAWLVPGMPPLRFSPYGVTTASAPSWRGFHPSPVRSQVFSTSQRFTLLTASRPCFMPLTPMGFRPLEYFLAKSCCSSQSHNSPVVSIASTTPETLLKAFSCRLSSTRRIRLRPLLDARVTVTNHPRRHYSRVHRTDSPPGEPDRSSQRTTQNKPPNFSKSHHR